MLQAVFTWHEISGNHNTQTHTTNPPTNQSQQLNCDTEKAPSAFPTYLNECFPPRSFQSVNTVWWVFDGCLMSVWWLFDGCLVSVWCVSDGCLMSVWWVYDEFLIQYVSGLQEAPQNNWVRQGKGILFTQHTFNTGQFKVLYMIQW